ncbi:hypothetical protein D3C78_1838770 [compost metagenome]
MEFYKKERNQLKVYLLEMPYQKLGIVFTKISTVTVNLQQQMTVASLEMHNQILFLD